MSTNPSWLTYSHLPLRSLNISLSTEKTEHDKGKQRWGRTETSEQPRQALMVLVDVESNGSYGSFSERQAFVNRNMHVRSVAQPECRDRATSMTVTFGCR